MNRSNKSTKVSKAEMVILLCEEIIQDISQRSLGRELTREELKHLAEEIEKRFCCKTLLERASKEYLFGEEALTGGVSISRIQKDIDRCFESF